MTTYLGEKAVGVGTVKATMNVGKVITDKKTVLGDGFTEPLAVNTLLFATTEGIAASADALRAEMNNKIAVVNASIDGVSEAVAKTRNDYEVADQEIRAVMNEKDAELEHIITEHAEELTTLRGNQASLGEQVSGIEEKIPESASGTNHLITKRQLLDEEMDIRDDLNESVSELQTQITAQAAEIAGKQDKLTAGDNIVISGNVISATGGDAGFDVAVVQELPAEGQKGIIYLLAKDSEAPDIYDEYIWVTVTQTFEFIGTTQVDLSDYATKEELNAILPNQTDNAGKFLTTDGTEASWSDKPLVNKATGMGSLSVGGGNAKQRNTTVVGMYAGGNSRNFSTIVGYSAESRGDYGVAVGYSALVGIDATRAVQLGNGINNDANTFKVSNANGNFEMMDANGNVPLDRLTYVTDQIGDISTALTAILGE